MSSDTSKITYLDKNNVSAEGSVDRTFFAHEANEVKNVVNSHADDINALESGKADLIGGKVDPTQLPDEVFLDIIEPTETTLVAFVANYAAYTYQKGDLISVTASGAVSNYLYKGVDKGLVANYKELAGSDAIYSTTLSDTLAMPSAWNSLAAGTTVSDLKSIGNLSGIMDAALFPEVLAFVSISNALTFSGVTSNTLEAGTAINTPFVSTYNQGQIKNGGGDVAGVLTGAMLTSAIKNVQSDITIHTELVVVSNTDSFSVIGFNIIFGDNSWRNDITYAIGTTAYESNKANAGSNLSGQQAAGGLNKTSNVVYGRYNRWHYLGAQSSSPTTSATVRALNTNSLLDGSNTGLFNVAIPAATQEFSFYCPTGKTISIIDTGNLNNDLTSSFVSTALNVNDANATAVAYQKHTIFLGLGGYLSDTNFQITIS